MVEVLSPIDGDFDRGAKRKQYLEHGVPELWLVGADEPTVEVWLSEVPEPEVVRNAPTWRVAGRPPFVDAGTLRFSGDTAMLSLVADGRFGSRVEFRCRGR